MKNVMTQKLPIYFLNFGPIGFLIAYISTDKIKTYFTILVLRYVHYTRKYKRWPWNVRL